MSKAIEWTPQLETAVLFEIESGSTLRATASKNKISASAIIRHAQADEEFAKQYARAIDIRTDKDFESLDDEIAQMPERVDGKVDTGWVQWQRVRIDTKKWALSKRVPKKYGDKVQNEHSSPDGGPPVFIIKSILDK